jgi:hypothetical protein
MSDPYDVQAVGTDKSGATMALVIPAGCDVSLCFWPTRADYDADRATEADELDWWDRTTATLGYGTVVEAVEAFVDHLDDTSLEAVITGTLRVTDVREYQLRAWNRAMDRANGYTLL